MTDDDEKVLNHVVPDGKAWDAHQRAHFIKKHGVEEGTKIADANLAAKLAKWRPIMEAERARLGANYKNRKERDAEEKVRQDAEIAERLAEMRQQEAQKQADFRAAVTAEVTRILNERATNGRYP